MAAEADASRSQFSFARRLPGSTPTLKLGPSSVLRTGCLHYRSVVDSDITAQYERWFPGDAEILKGRKPVPQTPPSGQFTRAYPIGSLSRRWAIMGVEPNRRRRTLCDAPSEPARRKAG